MAGGFAGATIVGAAYTAPELAREVLYLLPGNMPVTLTTMRWIMRGAYAATGGTAGLNLLFQVSEAVEMAFGNNNTLKELMCNMLGPRAGQDTYEDLYMMTSVLAWYMIWTGAIVSQAQDPE